MRQSKVESFHCNLRHLALLLLVFHLIAGPQTAKADTEYGSAQSLFQACSVYIEGTGDFQTQDCLTRAWTIQATIAVLGSIEPTFDRLYCLPKIGWSNDQAIRIFVKYAKDRPEKLHLPAEFMFIMALKAAFPCR